MGGRMWERDESIMSGANKNNFFLRFIGDGVKEAEGKSGCYLGKYESWG